MVFSLSINRTPESHAILANARGKKALAAGVRSDDAFDCYCASVSGVSKSDKGVSL